MFFPGIYFKHVNHELAKHLILTNILLKTSCLAFGSLDVIYRTIRLIMSPMRDEFIRKVILIST